MKEPGEKSFANYDDFFACYVQQHSQLANRLMHACGTGLGLLTIAVAFAMGKPWWAFLWLPIAYGFAWTGHFFIEKNRPATFKYPFWSFISDFRMLALMLTGRLQPWLERGRNP